MHYRQNKSIFQGLIDSSEWGAMDARKVMKAASKAGHLGKAKG
jgi:hypothetical protein